MLSDIATFRTSPHWPKTFADPLQDAGRKTDKRL
jgi:hypothetical protein